MRRTAPCGRGSVSAVRRTIALAAVLLAPRRRHGGAARRHAQQRLGVFATVVGGAKQHGERNRRAGAMTLHFEDRSHPIVQGAADN